MLSVIMLSVTMLSVIMLSVIMLVVVAQKKKYERTLIYLFLQQKILICRKTFSFVKEMKELWLGCHVGASAIAQMLQHSTTWESKKALNSIWWQSLMLYFCNLNIWEISWSVFH